MQATSGEKPWDVAMAEKTWGPVIELVPGGERSLLVLAAMIDSVAVTSVVLLPSEERLPAVLFLIGALVLTGPLIVAQALVQRRHAKDLTGPNLDKKVNELILKLGEAQYIPHVLFAIARGGLPVASRLAIKLLGPGVPIITLTRSADGRFDNAFNEFRLTRADFPNVVDGKVRVLIVDDACLHGGALDDARKHVAARVSPEDFVIETAAVSLRRGLYDHVISPSFWVEDTDHRIITASGERE